MRKAKKVGDVLSGPWDMPWEENGLESIESCPACGDVSREIMYLDLVDNAFRVAPGKWQMWKCSSCFSAYLDPRPTWETIHLAYKNYYTHEEAVKKDDYASLSMFRKLRRRLVNGYTNWRFSTQAMPASSFGILAVYAIPGLKKLLDREYRNIPKLPNRGCKLLDVGCGDGAFLRLARTCGWDATGLDPDPVAAANAAKQGIKVYEGGIEYFEGKRDLFDVITLNHVIEHVHEPTKVLKTCHDLLKPGGLLWLETPNIDAFGHARFRNNWRGIETPRHLVLFNRQSLIQCLVNSGFSKLREKKRPSPIRAMFQSSSALEQGLSPYELFKTSKSVQWHARLSELAEVMLPKRREFLTIVAWKEA